MRHPRHRPKVASPPLAQLPDVASGRQIGWFRPGRSASRDPVPFRRRSLSPGRSPAPAACRGSDRRTPGAWRTAPSAARARLRRRHHGEGSRRDRCAACAPYSRRAAQAFRRELPSAARTRLHRAAAQGFLTPDPESASPAGVRIPRQAGLLRFDQIERVCKSDASDRHCCIHLMIV